MIITSSGINTQPLAADLARILGDGSGLMAEAIGTQRGLIEPEHFLVHLARTPGSIVRADMLDAFKISLPTFSELIYLGLDDRPSSSGIPLQFNDEALSPASRALFAQFEQEMTRLGLQKGSEALFLSVLLKNQTSGTVSTLTSMFGSPEKYAAFCQRLDALGTRPEIQTADPQALVFDEQGRVRENSFNRSGRRVLQILCEETAATGYTRASVKHLLFALLDIENGALRAVLQAQGIDPLKEIHAPLMRQLVRPGCKRVPNFELRSDTLHETVARVLVTAAAEAQKAGEAISEIHLARALVNMRSGLAVEFLASRKVNLDELREYLAQYETETDAGNDYRRLSIQEIEAELKGHVLEQDHAIRQILPWIKRLRFGFPRERGPAAVLLFMGPSGTGKTQLAKELARTVYGSEDALIMLEMGQFNTKESINQFIGAPPGYIGYGEGKLTNGLRDKPESVVLFDEIEKAHEEVWVALLRFLDEGLISDPAGPTRDGRRCIIVLTSNLGADTLAQNLPVDDENAPQINHALEQEIRNTVLPYLKRPEIYNRVDDKVVLRPFTRQGYQKLVRRQIEVERNKFMDLHDVDLVVQEEAEAWLAEQAERAKLEGARCVPRLVNRFVVAPTIDLLTQDEARPPRQVIISKYGEGTKAER
jgi:ATP-dependent Clp protease ATP-binding subunit ClpC